VKSGVVEQILVGGDYQWSAGVAGQRDDVVVVGSRTIRSGSIGLASMMALVSIWVTARRATVSLIRALQSEFILRFLRISAISAGHAMACTVAC
jgi:hypothetical protein